MRSYFFTTVVVIAAILIFATHAAFLSRLTLNLPITSVALLTLLTPRLAAWRWALIIGVLYELASPYPFLTVFLATLFAFVAAQRINQTYISHRTVLGAATLCIVTLFTFELGIFLAAYLTQFFSPGWVPILNFNYLIFVLSRTALSVTLGMFVLILLRHFSSRTRGTVIQFG